MPRTYSSSIDDDFPNVGFTQWAPYPTKLFNNLNADQKRVFQKLLNKKPGESFDIEKELSAIIKPLKGMFQKKLTYGEILQKIIKHYNLPGTNSSVKKMEEQILLHKFQENYDKLSPEEKKKFQDQLNKVLENQNLENSQLASLGTVGALALAELSGMGLYIMASTLVGGLTSLLGITLPFAFYTGMSSFLAFVTGPVGWAIGIGAFAYSIRNESLESISNKFTTTFTASKNFVRGNYELASVIIVQICAFRIILNQEKNKEIEVLNAKIVEERKRKEKVFSKAEMVEVQLQRILEEKKALNQKLEKISSSIRNSEESIKNLKSKLI
ncbi:hypothetical protein [Christiangramia sp.]|uniref:hypothetical protein n=1 Tax=Christiangramia sp. TaxID=1931228 RepID=UPI00262DD4E9|nr:hypothetical protein [Christiangramia sp.]